MADGKERAERGSQRERVLAHRAEILAMLDAGARHATIQAKLDLQDIPQSTFQYHVARIRDAARSMPLAPAQAAQTQPPSPARSAEPAPSRSPEPAKDDAQPERVKPLKPDADEPKKPAPKRRKFVQVGVEPEKPEKSMNPADWTKKLES